MKRFLVLAATSGRTNMFKNNVSFAWTSSLQGGLEIHTSAIQQNNSWNLPVTANAADFADLSEAAAKAPRQPGGSLPTGFARLVAGSDLIDQGVDVGIPFNGPAPHLGAHEYGP